MKLVDKDRGNNQHLFYHDNIESHICLTSKYTLKHDKKLVLISKIENS